MTRTIPHHSDALSFMVRKGRKQGGGVDNWAVEGTGKFSTDCERGRALADEFIAYFGEFTTNGNMTLLAGIVIDMVTKGDVPKGLIIGFMNRVSEPLAIGARLLHEVHRASLDTPSEGTLERAIVNWREANEALTAARVSNPAVDHDEEYSARDAAETAMILHPCETIEDVRRKARIIMEDENVFDSVADCLVEPQGEHMLMGFCRSLLGEVTPLKGGDA